MKPTFRKTPEEKMAESTQKSVDTLGTVASKVEATTKAIQGLHQTAKDRSEMVLGFTGLIQEQKDTNDILEEIASKDDSKVIQKLEEVKSASLITNKLLKDIRDKEEQEMPSNSTVEGLLSTLIDQMKQPVECTVTLELV